MGHKRGRIYHEINQRGRAGATPPCNFNFWITIGCIKDKGIYQVNLEVDKATSKKIVHFKLLLKI